ncbi:17309_t:CDS:2 [Acaulospora morrowiae]|uniref:17309_t:CDS:1 n=1 Tax=Acaulospora morrowiae TaxID=94023 RepID=A0A9N9EGH1_9GLOM|nr:17309_t:CDS:2 [Acaulospora morrowiae]
MWIATGSRVTCTDNPFSPQSPLVIRLFCGSYIFSTISGWLIVIQLSATSALHLILWRRLRSNNNRNLIEILVHKEYQQYNNSKVSTIEFADSSKETNDGMGMSRGSHVLLDLISSYSDESAANSLENGGQRVCSL